ncbi:hypothetical protein SteCoe_39381 [Stentor coeruleus]|uniref:Uncharacterized protein n=1 Tax=Stentor coeruleus TaxID=5963 RepID=A0A1R2AKN5_9CILI|nr:hypothetical protein SteCoe_39381 [Stentor coeruleus]
MEESSQEKDSENEFQESEINCIKLFKLILDTSQSFKIFKFILHEETVQKISNMLPENFRLIGVYGDTNVILEFIEKIFQKKLPEFRIKEGIYFFQDRIEKNGILAYFTKDSSIYNVRPIKTSTRITNIVRILSDLCFKIVACISNEMIENWYFEKDGKLNPYIPIIHMRGNSNPRVQENSLQGIILKSKCHSQKPCVIPKDNSEWIFQWDSEEISQDDILNYSNKVLEFYQSIIKVPSKYNVPGTLNAKFLDFQSSTKIFSIDSEKLKNCIR